MKTNTDNLPNSISETFHNPDLEKVTVLINNIIEKIYESVVVDILNDDDVVNKEYRYGFALTRDINPCEWLGEDNFVVYDIVLDEENPKTSAKFSEYAEGCGTIEAEDNVLGTPAILHGGLLYLRCGLSTRADADLASVMNQFKVCIRHEIEHAYKELFIQKMFRTDNDDANDSESDDSFNTAYDHIESVLFGKLRGARSEEKNLLVAIYHLNYVERSAHVSGFYQRISNDACSGKVCPIDDYFEYKAYVADLNFIKKFNDLDLFRKYKDDIVCLFGRSTKNLQIFKRRLASHASSTIRKIKSIYGFFKKNNNVLLKKESIDIALEKYNKKRFEKISVLKEREDDELIMVYNVLSRDYFFTRQDWMLVVANRFFKGQSFSKYYKNVPYNSFLKN